MFEMNKGTQIKEYIWLEHNYRNKWYFIPSTQLREQWCFNENTSSFCSLNNILQLLPVYIILTKQVDFFFNNRHRMDNLYCLIYNGWIQLGKRFYKTEPQNSLGKKTKKQILLQESINPRY